MSKIGKLYDKLRNTDTDNNFTFEEMHKILTSLKFESWNYASSHIIYKREDIYEMINVQLIKGKKQLKGYQVREIRKVLKKYNLI